MWIPGVLVALLAMLASVAICVSAGRQDDEYGRGDRGAVRITDDDRTGMRILAAIWALMLFAAVVAIARRVDDPRPITVKPADVYIVDPHITVATSAPATPAELDR